MRELRAALASIDTDYLLQRNSRRLHAAAVGDASD
jgi:hypothetical protein